MTAGGSTYMPLRVNMAGVILVIFAAAVMAFRRRSASTSCRRTKSTALPADWGRTRSCRLPDRHLHVLYTAVQFNPVDQADNPRYGGYIPGIRPGPPTAQY